MDARFGPAEKAIHAGDVDQLKAFLAADPELATARSTRSHPNLMQCLVLVSPPPKKLEQLIRLLADHGSQLTNPLIAATCLDNVRAIKELLALGAAIDGNGVWSPLEEALYWGFEASANLLLERGAVVDNLRKAAALGRMDVLLACFDETGALTEQAGQIVSPFDKWDRLDAPEQRHDRQQILNNALVYAAAWGQQGTMQELLDRGAEVNAIPLGFDFAGTALHYAALRGRRETVDWLLQRGADPAVRDAKIDKLPEDWAAHDGHAELSAHLKQRRQRG